MAARPPPAEHVVRIRALPDGSVAVRFVDGKFELGATVWEDQPAVGIQALRGFCKRITAHVAEKRREGAA